MAIVINSNPVDYSSLHGDLIFVVYEATKATDPVTYPGYKYVADIYIGGVMEHRLKVSPRPDNKRGVFNIGPVVRNYLTAIQLQPSDQVNCQEFGDEFYLDVQVKFGEEINYTTTTNIITDSSRRYYNFYNNRTVDYSATPILESKSGLTASNRPTSIPITVEAGTKYYFMPYFMIVGASEVPLVVRTYNSSGTPLNTYSINPSVVSDEKLIQLNLSPYCLNDAAGVSLTNVAYYTCEISTGTYRFDIKCAGLYTPYMVHWLNQYGGFESFQFGKVSRKTYDNDKKSFQQLPYRISSAGAVEYGASTAEGYIVHETKTTYASTFREKMKLSTDNLTDEEFVWLKEIQLSPLVYVEIDGNLFPVTLQGTNYEERKYINDKMQSLQIDVDFGLQLNAQFR